MFKFAKTIFKNLFSVPPTRKYPIEKREPFKGARGHIKVDIDSCILCGICDKQCPVGAITVDKESKHWEVDWFKCITCGYCVEKCPKKSITMYEDYTKAASEKQRYKAVKPDKPEERHETQE